MSAKVLGFAIYGIGILLGLAAGAVVCVYLRGKTKIFAGPRSVWWLGLLFAEVLAVFSAVKSTAPSLTPRITLSGKAINCFTEYSGQRHRFEKNIFRLDPEYQGPIWIETQILGPMCWASSMRTDRRTYRIVYLADEKRSLSNKAISI